VSPLAEGEIGWLRGLGLVAADADLAAMAEADRVAAAEAKAAEAWAADSPRKGVELAQAALAESVYCPAALTLLSLFVARDLAERVRFLRLAVAAGSDDGLAGLEARQHLASALAVSGERGEAFGLWRAVLAADPADPTRARFDFLDALVDAGHDDEARGLLAAWPDDAQARIAYARALLAFRAGAADADALLAAAIRANGFVPAYLVGDRKPPKSAPPAVEPGSRDEAIVIAVNAGRAWGATKGAVEWVRRKRR
jgi:hypothetical protein